MTSTESISVSCQADCHKLEQLALGALATAFQGLVGVESDVDAVYESLQVATVQQGRTSMLLKACVEKSSRQFTGGQKAYPATEWLPAEDEIQRMEAEAAIALQILQQERLIRPQKIAKLLLECLQSSRPEVSGTLREENVHMSSSYKPDGDELQNVVSQSGDKIPTLRARLGEALGRLGRVLAALSEEKMASVKSELQTAITADSVGGPVHLKKEILASNA